MGEEKEKAEIHFVKARTGRRVHAAALRKRRETQGPRGRRKTAARPRGRVTKPMAGTATRLESKETVERR